MSKKHGRQKIIEIKKNMKVSGSGLAMRGAGLREMKFSLSACPNKFCMCDYNSEKMFKYLKLNHYNN